MLAGWHYGVRQCSSKMSPLSSTKVNQSIDEVSGLAKSSWSDSHICLTRSGAVEARSIRGLPEQFDGHDADPLPWTPVAIFGPRHSYEDKVCSARQRLAEAAEEATGEEQVEKEAKIDW